MIQKQVDAAQVLHGRGLNDSLNTLDEIDESEDALKELETELAKAQQEVLKSEAAANRRSQLLVKSQHQAKKDHRVCSTVALPCKGSL